MWRHDVHVEERGRLHCGFPIVMNHLLVARPVPPTAPRTRDGSAIACTFDAQPCRRRAHRAGVNATNAFDTARYGLARALQISLPERQRLMCLLRELCKDMSMEAPDDSRKQWASLLTGASNPALALANWIGLAASVLSTGPSSWSTQQQATRSAMDDGMTESVPGSRDTMAWAAALGPIVNAWTEALDNWQGAAPSWFSPAADSPLARLLNHPAAVVGSESSPGRLSMQAGLALVDFLQTAMAHQALQTQGWAKALQRFIAEFGATGAGEAQPMVVTSLDDLVTHWSTVGEAALQEHSRSEQFLQSQADCARACAIASLLLVYALVGRYSVADLQPGRSFVENLLRQGLDVYAIDWGHPTRADRWTTLDDYVNVLIDDCVDVLRKRHNVDAVNLLSICQRGVFNLCYAALHPEKVKNLVVVVTPVDFHADQSDDAVWRAFVNVWTRSVAREDIDLVVEALGNVPGRMTGAAFAMMNPVGTVQKYTQGIFRSLQDDESLRGFLRIEKWLYDQPDHPGEAARQWLEDLYQDNKLVRGELELGGQRVDLGNVRSPVLNIYAEQDHVVAPAAARALAQVVGTKDYTEESVP
jgi:polyhydroxyalkanoate synthase